MTPTTLTLTLTHTLTQTMTLTHSLTLTLTQTSLNPQPGLWRTSQNVLTLLLERGFYTEYKASTRTLSHTNQILTNVRSKKLSLIKVVRKPQESQK